MPPECALERAPWRPVAAVTREGVNGAITLTSSHTPLRLEVEREPFVARLVDRSGAALAELCDLAFAENGGVRVALAVRPGERFFGFGDAPGALDKRGRRLLLDNRDPQASIGRSAPRVAIPFFLVHRAGEADAGCCGVLLDTFGAARFDVAAAREDRVALEAASGGLDLMLLPGPLPRDVIERFTERVGRTSLPPLWALVHHQLRRVSGGERSVYTSTSGGGWQGGRSRGTPSAFRIRGACSRISRAAGCAPWAARVRA